MKNISLWGSSALVTLMLSPMAVAQQAANNLNPAISLVLQGQMAEYKQPVVDYELPGFMLGGESGLASAGLGLGHGELSFSANVDDFFLEK